MIKNRRKNLRRYQLPFMLFLGLFGFLFLFSGLSLLWALGGLIASSMILLLVRSHDFDAKAKMADWESDTHRPDMLPTSQSSLRAMMVDGIEEPLLLIAPDRTVMDANSAAKVLFGEQMIGQDISLHVRHPAILGALADILSGASQQKVEVTLTGLVDRLYAVSLSRVNSQLQTSDVSTKKSAAGADADKSGFHVVLSMHDFTQMKKIEQMRADFVANASHELRTPLSSIIGFLETLDGPARDDRQAQKRFLGIMHDEALRMVRLIDDLLSLSRIEIDKHVQPQERVDIPALLSAVIRSLEPVAAKRHMDVTLVLPSPPVPPVRGDMDQLRQVVQNLLSNALKYGAQGTTVVIKVSRLDHLPGQIAQAGLAIAVVDQGEGIDAQHIPRLTERFYRIDTARSRQLGGTGLGLAIVKHITGRHRGNLAIESTVGKGTTVTVSLPVFEQVTTRQNEERQDGT